MSLEDGSSNPEVSVASGPWEETPYVSKAQAEVDKSRKLPAYRALADLREAHKLTLNNSPAPIRILFTEVELRIPYKSPQAQTGIKRKIHEIELAADDYKNEDDRYSAFVRGLPKLKMLIAFGNLSAGNVHYYDRMCEDIEITGGLGLTPTQLAKYNAVDLSSYNLDAITFTPKGTDFKLIWGKYGRLEGPKIDTRYLSTHDGKKFYHPQTPDQWKAVVEAKHAELAHT